jgi:hypothetical protein
VPRGRGLWRSLTDRRNQIYNGALTTTFAVSAPCATVPPVKENALMSLSLSRASLSLLLILSMAVLATAQVCPSPLPFSFEGLNGNGVGTPNNQAVLNILTSTDSSDAANSDNTAHAGLGEPITLEFGSSRVSAGAPFTLAFSLGVVPTGISSPTTIDGTVWLDAANPQNVFPLIDGLALASGTPNPFGTTAGPGTPNIFALNTGNDPAILNTCFTVQSIVLDPAAPAPFNLAVSNPIALGIVPRIQGMTPSITTPGATIQIFAGGINPAGGDTVGFELGLNSVTSANGLVAVPTGAISGRIEANLGGSNSIPSEDGIEDWVVVTDPNLQPGPTLITTTPDPNVPLLGTERATGFSAFSGPGLSATWSISLNAGDILDVEVYSIDAGLTRILDGRGNALNPFASEGFDPAVTLRVAGNPDQLVFDTAASGQNLHFDDDSGPANNAHLRWQARYNTNYDIVVTDSNPGAFVTGDYLINIRVQTGVPGVTGFNVGGNRVNIGSQNANVVINAANVVPGGIYSVIMEPRAGAPFMPTVINSTLVQAPGLLQFTVPSASDLPIGLHQVRIRDEGTLYEGLAWDNSNFSPADGVLPDLFCIRGATVTQADTTALIGGATQITNLNAESVIFGPTSLSPTTLGNGFVRAVVPATPWSVLYAEALAIDPTQPDLFDSTSQFLAGGGVGTGMYNPILNVFYPNLLVSGPYNDNDGVVPAPLFDGPLGIGRNAALIDFQAPIVNPTGGNFLFLVRENIITGAGASHACMVNVVAQ